MRFVLDASITISWAMRDEDHPIADLAMSELGRGGSALVPGIWWYEVRNLLVVGERRHRISEPDSLQFLRELAHLPVQVDHQIESASVMELARKFSLTVYDAAYLALALRERAPLASLDKALQSAASAAGVATLA